MRFEAFSFGSICIDGMTYGYDLVIDRGRNPASARKNRPKGFPWTEFGAYTALDRRRR